MSFPPPFFLSPSLPNTHYAELAGFSDNGTMALCHLTIFFKSTHSIQVLYSLFLSYQTIWFCFSQCECSNDPVVCCKFFLDIKMFKDFKIKIFNFPYLKYHLKLSIFKFYEIYECLYIYKIEMYMRWTRKTYVQVLICHRKVHRINCLTSPRVFPPRQIQSDSLLCDCQLRWFPEWLVARGLQAGVVATCAHPESLKGISIFQAQAESFVCGEYAPKPVGSLLTLGVTSLQYDTFSSQSLASYCYWPPNCLCELKKK